jgi:hypothetical protein
MKGTYVVVRYVAFGGGFNVRGWCHIIYRVVPNENQLLNKVSSGASLYVFLSLANITSTAFVSGLEYFFKENTVIFFFTSLNHLIASLFIKRK